MPPGKLLVVTLLAFGCARISDGAPAPSTSASTPASNLSPVPLDHLAPGELQASAELSFGFPIPTTMKLVRAFSDEAHLTGEVEIQGLVRYVQAHALTTPPELRGNTLVFSNVRMKHGPLDRTFRLEIIAKGKTTTLRVKDTTPAATSEAQNTTDEERWRKAGYKPNGEPLDVGQLK